MHQSRCIYPPVMHSELGTRSGGVVVEAGTGSPRQWSMRRHQRPCPCRRRRSPEERPPRLNPPRYILSQREAHTHTNQTQQPFKLCTNNAAHRTDAATNRSSNVHLYRINHCRQLPVGGEFDWVRFLAVCFLYKTNPNPRKKYLLSENLIFLGFGWPWVGEFFGFIIFIRFPTQQNLVYRYRKYPHAAQSEG